MNRTVLAFGQYSSVRGWVQVLNELARLRPTDEDRPTAIVPSHGAIGDSTLIAYQRGFLQGVQARVGELKAQGRSEEQTVQAVTGEFQARYSFWNATNRIGAIARNAYAEAPLP
jgi:hypothetical protein